MFDKEVEKYLLELRDVLCDERIAEYCIENGIAWSDSAMTGSPVEILLLAKELIEYGMMEKLGVLLVDVPEPNKYKYSYLEFNHYKNNFRIEYTDASMIVSQFGFKCTQEEAKKYPQFRWVSLEELK
ncbi:hypothetical protein [Streptococcus sp. VTCC 12886]|uniref:hypothetical protein n=1 Tax=Streptococcus sp. VTCC 12886 TaxID=3413767 RepID=UPI003D9C68BA